MPKIPSAAPRRGLELGLGRELGAAQRHVVGDPRDRGHRDRLPAAQPLLVGLDRIADDDEVLHADGQAGLILLDPASELADADLGGACGLLVKQLRPGVAEDERLLVHHPELERVGDLLQRRDVAARHLVATDLVLGGLVDDGDHRVELGQPEVVPASVRIKVGMQRVAVVKELEAEPLEGAPAAPARPACAVRDRAPASSRAR